MAVEEGVEALMERERERVFLRVSMKLENFSCKPTVKKP